MRHTYFATLGELFLDYDNPEGLYKFQTMIHQWPCVQKTEGYAIFPSYTISHYQVFVDLIVPCKNWEEYVELTLILGSDPKRARADLARYYDGATQPSCLIKYSGRPYPQIRKPDISCTHPAAIKGEKLRACDCLREKKEHHWYAGTKKYCPYTIKRKVNKFWASYAKPTQ